MTKLLLSLLLLTPVAARAGTALRSQDMPSGLMVSASTPTASAAVLEVRVSSNIKPSDYVFIVSSFNATALLTVVESGAVGIGTPSPTSALTVYGIATSSSPVPSISCTAGTGVIGANSNSQSGTFTAGSLSTACTVTFVTAFPKAPVCVCNASTPLALSATTATNSVTCTAATALTGDTLNYFCWSAP